MRDEIQMTTEIWFFSGTGQGAELARKLKSYLDICKICNITSRVTRCKLQRDITNKNIILIYPVYGSSLPAPLQIFLKQLQGHGSNVILLSLWGNAHAGNNLSLAQTILTAQGFCVIGAAQIVAQHSCLISRQKSTFTHERVGSIVQYIASALEKKSAVTIPTNQDSILIRALCSIPNSGLVKHVTSLKFNLDICTNCNACVNICPTSARISPQQVIEKSCIRCYACVTCCPQRAIQMHVSPLAKFALGHHQKVVHDDCFYSHSEYEGQEVHS